MCNAQSDHLALGLARLGLQHSRQDLFEVLVRLVPSSPCFVRLLAAPLTERLELLKVCERQQRDTLSAIANVGLELHATSYGVPIKAWLHEVRGVYTASGSIQ